MRESQQIAYDLGWDFAMFRKPLPEDAPGTFCDGYRAFKHGGKRSTQAPDIYQKKWLQIRWGALQRGKKFDSIISPMYLSQLLPSDYCCPVTLESLTVATLTDTDWSIERADNDEGYVPGNVIVISIKANKAKSDLSLDDIRRIVDGDVSNDALSLEEWKRLLGVVEPMHEDRDSSRGVEICTGQHIAPGTPVSPVVKLQRYLTLAVRLQMDPQDRRLGHMFVNALCKSLCSDKKSRRAFRQLYLVVCKRVKRIDDDYRMWETPRIQRKLLDFLRLLKESGASCNVDGLEESMSDLYGSHQSDLREAMARFGTPSQSLNPR